MTLPTETQIVRRTELLKRFGMSKTWLHNQIHEGTMPPSIPLGARAVGWLKHELDSVLAAMAVGESKEHLRQLVGTLVSQRKELPEKLKDTA